MVCAKCGVKITKSDSVKINKKSYCSLLCAGLAEELPVKFKLKENTNVRD